jgi:hypothetical protein
MAEALQPSVRVSLVHTLVPAEEGTVTRRWASRPFADAGAWTEGRVEKISGITRAASTPDGDYEIATCDVELTDADGFIRGLLADPVSRTLTAREIAVELLSEAGRAAELDWRSMLRGRVTDVQALVGRRARVRLADEVGSHFSGFDLDKAIGVRMTHDIIPGLPPESVNRIFPIVLGEHSDLGALDENGDEADKGMLPFVDAGWVSIGADGDVLYENLEMPRLAAPEGFTGSVTGTPGSRQRRYVVTAFSAVGETTASVTIVVFIPDTMDETRYVDLEWAATGDGTAGYHVYANGRRMETLGPDVTTFRDEGSSSASGPSPPTTNSAYIDQDINGVAYQVHRMFVAKINAASEIFHVYGSNLAAGETPRRIRLPEAVYPEQVKIYGRPGYPHADPFIERAGVRFAPMYARGPLVDHHLRGIVTFAWNGCGDDEVGDGTGPTITEAFYQLQHLINEYVLKDGGIGYRSGDFGPLEQFSTGIEKLKTSAFEAAQDLTVEWIGNRGYQGSIALTTPVSLREFLRRFAVTFACHYATDHFGQFYPFLINDTADPEDGRHYRDRIEVIRMVSQEIKHDQVETKVVFHFDFNTDAQTFTYTDNVLEDTLATEAHGGVPRQRTVRQCFYTRDVATAFDSNARHLSRYKVAPRYVAIEVDYTGLHDENGDQIRLTHYDGAGGVDGDVATPFVVMGHTTNPHDPNSVILLGFDLQRISTLAFPLLEDEDTMDGNLWDETVNAPPPDGAYELR